MRLCRFDGSRLGVVDGEDVREVTALIDRLPASRWPLPPGDPLVAHLDEIVAAVPSVLERAAVHALAELRLDSPVANPSKIIGAPVNYARHHEEARADAGINYGSDVKTIDTYGLFLKSNTSLVGPGQGVTIRHPDRRTDHEVELAVVIGKSADSVTREQAMAHVAGYAISLDMSIRGTEDRSLRKSVDSYSVLGPWLVTADEIADPGTLDLEVAVNGEVRQRSNTAALIFDVPRLIEYASGFFRLYPGDIIMTGTPEGVGPVRPGDTMACRIDGVGAMQVTVS